MRPQALTEDQIRTQLAGLPRWRREGDAIVAEFECRSYGAACGLVMQTALAAERLDHHPDVTWRYRKVSFLLSTHDAGGLSALDFSLAAQIESFAALA